MSVIGSKIKIFRLEKGLTQKALGEKCGLADSAIRRYELGGANPKLSTLKKIADALDIEIGDLLGLAPEARKDFDKFMQGDIEHIVPNDSMAGMLLFELDDEGKLLDHYRSLNSLGKEEAIKRVEELTEITKYTKLE